MAENAYTKLTLEIKRATDPQPERFSIETNVADLDACAFLNNLVIPLMLATGYAPETIQDALGRADYDE